MKKILFEFNNQPPNIPEINNWVDNEMYFKSGNDDFIFCDYISKVLNDDILAYFDISLKRAYKCDEFKKMLIKYLNYFLTYFDKDKELIDIYIKIKVKCDISNYYPIKEFYDDLSRYLLSPIILQKTYNMNIYNSYEVESKRSYIHESLVYKTHHTNVLYHISLLIKMAIPLLLHYAKVKAENVVSINEFLLIFYHKIFDVFDVDIRRKILATIENETKKAFSKNYKIWYKQDIRGNNTSVNISDNFNSILLTVIGKMTYALPGHTLIYKSIRHNIDNTTVNAKYDFEYLKIGSNNKPNINEFDMFEINVVNTSEATAIYFQHNSDFVLNYLSNKYQIDENLINHYHKELSLNSNNIINPFQEKLIFYVFYKYYGECNSIKNTNSKDYIKLMLIARDILRSEKLFLLAEIISSRVVSMSSRKDLNKKEKVLIETSELYHSVMEKYGYDERNISEIRSIIATIITSEFQIIDPDSENYGSMLTILPNVVIYQVLSYINLI